MMYGGSEEYDVEARSMMYDVVCTKITIVKEKHYLKINSPLNHMNSHYTTGWSELHEHLPKYLI